MSLDTAEDLIADYQAGRMIILMDDEDRENEGDLLVAAQHVSPEAINFMASHGRGLICLALTSERCEQLQLPLMVSRNRAPHGTAFTVSIEAAKGVTTGISAADRATTVRAAAAAHAGPADIVQPGHIFPLRAAPGGVLNRAGHTEAGVDLARLAGLEPASVLCEILNTDGSMARLPQLVDFARQHELRIGTVADLIRYRLENETTVERVSCEPFATRWGEFSLLVYRDRIDGATHLALSCGEIHRDQETAVRVHVHNGHFQRFAELGAGYQWPLAKTLEYLSQSPPGVLVLIDKPEDTPELPQLRVQLGLGETGESDAGRGVAPLLWRTVGAGSRILADLGVGRMCVLGKPQNIHSLSGFGLDIVRYIEEH
ncbi:MAG: 3,4-dihydroxy-2-butanone-4-phosphate synthase [Gammaproteobacteria bacterium]|nr:3,4-dihydroxy-2-butanone-4-phosphate synthase [Gammaproteobacteria bacterium]